MILISKFELLKSIFTYEEILVIEKTKKESEIEELL